jgi:hypothetical protein
MITNKIVFSIDDTAKLIALLLDPLEYVGWNYSEPIKFLYHKSSMTLAKGPL